MPVLTGLPGTSGSVPVVFFRSAAECIRIMRHDSDAVTAASDNGCINVWRDRDGNLHAHVQQHRRTVDDAEFGEVGYRRLSKWISPRLKAIREPGRIGPWERKK